MLQTRATEVAAKIPAARAGTIEVRPIWEMSNWP